MYISMENIHELAELLGSLAVIGGALVALYKFFERDRKQGTSIRNIQE